MLKPAVNVVFLTDQNYANLTAVAIRSLVFEFEKSSSSREHSLDIFVVCIDVEREGRDDLTRAAQADHATSEISLTLVYHALPENLQARQRWTQLVSLKMHLPDILPSLSRAIFLDSDIVVVDDITKLWAVDLEGHWLGVVPCLNDHPGCLEHFNEFKIKYTHAGEPINAGVLLLDLELMRQRDVPAKLAEWQRNNMEKLRLPEQEAISANYPQQWKVLPHAWNFRAFGEPYWTASSWDQYKEFLGTRPSIVHFQDGGRPNVLNVKLPYSEQWWRHYYHVNPNGALKTKTLNYFYFIYFEYPDLCLRASNALPFRCGMLLFLLKVLLVGLLVFPKAIGRYLQYRRKPQTYELRINPLLAKPAGESTG